MKLYQSILLCSVMCCAIVVTIVESQRCRSKDGDNGCETGHSVVHWLNDHLSVTFDCPKSMNNRLSLERAVKHCSTPFHVVQSANGLPLCSDWLPNKSYVVNKTIVVMDEVKLTDDLKCQQNINVCQKEITQIRSFSLTTSYSAELSTNFEAVKLPIPISFSASYGEDWTRETGTEIHDTCGGVPGSTVWLSVSPKYYKVLAIKLKDKSPYYQHDKCHRLELYYVYVPLKNPDGTIQGERACKCRLNNGTMCKD